MNQEPRAEIHKHPMTAEDVKAVGLLAFAVVVILGVVALALWILTGGLEFGALRAWAVAATMLLPIVGGACFRWGLVESRGRMKGIDDGVGRVLQAADKAIDLRAKHAVTIKQAVQEPAPYVVLPAPEGSFSIRPQLTAGERVELE